MVANDKVLEKLNRIKKECKVCNGLGFSVVIENDVRIFKDCKCVEKIKKALSYIDANIPLRYVKWDISELTEKFKEENQDSYEYISNYIENVDSVVDDGQGFWLASSPGLAKSSIVSYIVRTAVDAGKTCYFDRATNFHSKLFEALNNPEAKEFLSFIINEVELLVIEEIDKIYLKDEMSFNNRAFFDFISEIYDSNKAVIITSNDQPNVVLQRFPTFIADRLCLLDNVILRGNYSGRR